MGQAALVPGNGVPLAITAGKIDEWGKMWITANIDHRAIDGDKPGAGLIHTFLQERIPKLIEEEYHASFSSRRK